MVQEASGAQSPINVERASLCLAARSSHIMAQDYEFQVRITAVVRVRQRAGSEFDDETVRIIGLVFETIA